MIPCVTSTEERERKQQNLKWKKQKIIEHERIHWTKNANKYKIGLRRLISNALLRRALACSQWPYAAPRPRPRTSRTPARMPRNTPVCSSRRVTSGLLNRKKLSAFERIFSFVLLTMIRMIKNKKTKLNHEQQPMTNEIVRLSKKGGRERVVDKPNDKCQSSNCSKWISWISRRDRCSNDRPTSLGGGARVLQSSNDGAVVRGRSLSLLSSDDSTLAIDRGFEIECGDCRCREMKSTVFWPKQNMETVCVNKRKEWNKNEIVQSIIAFTNRRRHNGI